MKTKLPDKISTVEEAKMFLRELYENRESYHPEDNAHEIVWGMAKEPIKEERDKLNNLMCDIYNLKGNDGRHSGEMIFDPCEYLNQLYTTYRVYDKSGRGGSTIMNELEIIENLIPDMEEYEEELKEWVSYADGGDQWENNNIKIIKE